MKTWPDLVIFDCDGVLVDSEAIALGRARAAFARLGVALSDDETRDLFLGVSRRSMRIIAKAELGAELPEGFEAELARETVAAFESELKGVEGLREALAGLGARVCVASSSSPERIGASLRIVGYEDLMGENVFSADAVERGKPAPDLFLLAADSLGARHERCLVIEDSAPGILAARSAGMEAFGFTGGQHARGIDYRTRLREAGACEIFHDMRDLPALVGRVRAAKLRGADGQDD